MRDGTLLGVTAGDLLQSRQLGHEDMTNNVHGSQALGFLEQSRFFVSAFYFSGVGVDHNVLELPQNAGDSAGRIGALQKNATQENSTYSF